ncbi:PPE domain-containing protein [Saccharopolyspora aridisoli]|uniref:PPE domain-containing protein n=2 Tax=Saccharopolyspora aridisoli TaxID=2530385 RepID=A0A4R4UKM3_9PSEU|nr:PPE domain-containing protein [Saccharopolyspora aridisoli]
MRGWVHGGAGSEALYENSKLWNAEDQYMRDLKIRLEDKLKQVGAVMKSESGEAMKDQAMPVVLWTEITADSAKLQSEQMTAQGEAFKKVQTSIPAKSEEQAVPDDMWIEESWDSLVTGSTDAEDAKAHNEKLRQEAVQAFTAYQDTTQGNVSGSAQFEQPPEIAVGSAGGTSSSSVPSVGGVGSPAPSSTSSAWAGGAGGAGGYAGGAGTGGAGGGAFGGGAAGTGAAWATPPGGGSGSNQNPGGAGRVPNGPGVPGGTPGLGAGRPGVPGSGAGGRSGAGSGAGGRAGAGRGLGAGSGAGAGGRAGVGGSGTGAGGRAGAGGLGGAAGAGGRGGAGAGAGAGARGRGQEGEDDLEHETPDYLIGDQGVFDEDLPKVAPPVFGDWDNQR